LDDQVVHGIPGPRKLAEGEIISVDVGVEYKGYFGDAAVSYPCGKVDEERARLLTVADRALSEGIRAARVGNYVGDIGRAVQRVAESAGFSVVRDYVGHGIGKAMHEAPQVPNFDSGEEGPKLKAGMVLAIEPMVNLGVYDVRKLKDNWTVVTADGKPSAHFEHSVVVRERGGQILSAAKDFAWGVSVL
jgi:methionyl aminopeptidase